MRDSHRSEAERLLRRAVEEEVRRSGGRTDGNVLLSRARGSLDAMAGHGRRGVRGLHPRPRRGGGRPAHLPAALRPGGRRHSPAGGRRGGGRRGGGRHGARHRHGHGGGRGSHRRGRGRRGDRGEGRRLARTGRPPPRRGRQPARRARAVAVAVADGAGSTRHPAVPGPAADARRVHRAEEDRAEAEGCRQERRARGRSALEQSFAHLPEPKGTFAGRRQEMARLRQWVQAARASTETKPTVVVLHGVPGSGRTTLAVRAAHELRDYFRGACVVDLRGDGPASGDESPLSTRDALLHLLNRLGAPREQLLFRERSSADQQVKRLSELYHQHLTGVPVTVVLDDASDAEQVRALVPERSDSLVLVTAREALRLPPDLPARVYDLPVEALDAAGRGGTAGGGRPGRVGALRRRVHRRDPAAVRRPAAGAAGGGVVAGTALRPRPGDRPGRLRAGGAGRAGAVAALHRPAGAGPAAAAPAGAGRPHLAGGRCRRRAAGHGRDGGDAAAGGAVARGSARPRPGQPLPAARRGARLRPGPARRRGRSRPSGRRRRNG